MPEVKCHECKFLMPVGKVFNAAENQVLISPVSSYYQGKAIRLAQRNDELVNEQIEKQNILLERDIEGDPDAEEKTRLQLEELRLNVQKKREELGDDEMQRRADAYGPIIEEATRMSEDGDLSGAINFANTELKLAAEKLGPEVLAEFVEAKGEDGALDKEEISRIKYGISAYYEMVETEQPDNPFAKINPKDFTQESVEEFQRTGDFSSLVKAETSKPDFEPPNKAELEVAMDLIKNDEKLDDLSRKEKRIAAMILANDIRNLQANEGLPYEQAADQAVKALKKKVKLEPDWLTGSDSVLELGAGELAENEYQGSDGNIYVDTPDGGFRRKN